MLFPTTPNDLLAAVEFFGQKANLHDIAVVGLLVVLEGVLSIDKQRITIVRAIRVENIVSGSINL